MNKLGFGCMMTAECEVEVFSLKSNRKKKTHIKRWKLLFVSIHTFPERNQLNHFVMFFPEELFPPIFLSCVNPRE